MNKTVGYNVHNTATHAPRTMAYLEHHHLTDIYRELMIKIAIDRPANIRHYVAEHLTHIGERVQITRTTVLVPPIFDSREFSQKYSKMYKCPVVEYTRKREDKDTKQILSGYRRFAKLHGLADKHIIAFNFPGNRSEVMECIDREVIPTNVIDVMPADQVPFKTHEQFRDENWPFVNDHRQVMEYFPHRSVEVKYGTCSLDEPPPRTVNKLSDLCHTVHQIARQPRGLHSHRLDACLPHGYWRPRIMMIGRKGAGRKTQATMLAKAMGLVFVDIDFLLLKYIQSDLDMGRIIEERLARCHKRCSDPFIVGLLQKRLMKPDCLHNGWIVVGYPTCKEDAVLVDDTFAVKPNRIFFLHCRLRECQRRLERQIERLEALANNKEFTRKAYADPRKIQTSCKGVHLMMDPAKAYRCIEREHIVYSLQIRDIAAYYDDRKEVCHIDGTHSVETVHSRMIAFATRQQIALNGQDSG